MSKKSKIAKGGSSGEPPSDRRIPIEGTLLGKKFKEHLAATRQKIVDREVFKLAEYFLAEVPLEAKSEHPNATQELAERIQDEIEMYLEFELGFVP